GAVAVDKPNRPRSIGPNGDVNCSCGEHGAHLEPLEGDARNTGTKTTHRVAVPFSSASTRPIGSAASAHEVCGRRVRGGASCLSSRVSVPHPGRWTLITPGHFCGPGERLMVSVGGGCKRGILAEPAVGGALMWRPLLVPAD